MRIASILALSLLTAAFGPGASAQITVTQADALALVTRTGTASSHDATSLTGAQVLADRSGASQTWDFSALTFAAPDVSQIAPATLPVPGSDNPHFSSATHVQQISLNDSTTYVYYQIGAGALEVLGFSGEIEIDGEDTTYALVFDPVQVEFPLPLTTASTWSSEYEFISSDALEGFSNVIHEESAVEGWGTLVTPAGQAPTLKVRTKIVSTTTFTIPGQPPFVLKDSSYTVTFVTKTGLSAHLSLNAEGTVGNAGYASFQTGTAAEPGESLHGSVRLAVSGANPVRRGDAVRLTFTLDAPGEARIHAFDLLGRRVAIVAQGPFAAGTHEASWHPADLPAGLYLLQLTSGGASTTRGVVLAD